MYKIIPVIGSRGAYVFRPPFDQLTVSGVEYTCQAIRRISEYVANNEDPKKTIYDNYGLSEADYDEDVAEDAYIVCLQSMKGHWVFVPYRYIETFPSGDGIAYASRMLVFSLPSLPLKLDLTDLIAEIKERIVGAIGVDSVAKEVQSSQPVLVTVERDEETTLQRDLRKNGMGLLQHNVKLLQENESLRHHLKMLEDYIKSL